MSERKRNPEEILEDMINKNVKFQILEIAAGVGAGVGSIALAVVKNAAFYAAAPLTLAVALNYFNRRRLDQLTRQQTLLDITEVQRRLSSEIQGARGRISDGGEIEFSNTEQFENAIASLSETVAALEMQMQQGVPAGGEAGGLAADVDQLRNNHLDLAQSVEALNQQIRHLPADGSKDYDGELSELKATLAHLQSSGAGQAGGADSEALRAEIQNLVNPLQAHISELESRLAQVSSSAAPSEAPVDLEPLRAEFSQIVSPVHQKLDALEERIAAQPTPAAANYQEDIQGVHGQVNALNEKLENIAAQLSAEIAGFQQSVEHTQHRVQAVHQTVQDAQVNAVTAPDSEAIQRDMEAALSPLHAKVSELQNHISSLPKVDPNLSQMQSEQMVSLQNQLNSTNGMIEELASQLHSELSKIPQIVDEKVERKVSTLPVAEPQDTKKSAMSELDDILAGINL